tara:strand:+ start:159 stop:425 length:267 start_codon:yes stop_codon:yes gene_type:complete
VPIKIKRGTASKVTLFIIPKILIGILLKIVGSNIPNGTQINANKMDTPARVKATGNPNKSVAQIRIKSKKGIISISDLIIDIEMSMLM